MDAICNHFSLLTKGKSIAAAFCFDSCVQFGGGDKKKDLEVVDHVQGRSAKMVEGLEHKS